MFSETKRQIVHITMVGWALLLRVMTWPQAAALAATALAFNAFVLPRAGGGAIFRPAEAARGAATGILLYPVSVLLLILAFRERLDIVAAAWAILAVGDGIATLAGRAMGGARIPWNPDKTWAGSIAFAAAGGAAGVFFCWWAQPNVPVRVAPEFLIGAPIAAAVVAALVETMRVRLDDNVSVPFAAGATLWVLSLVDRDTVAVMIPGIAGRVLPALAVNAGAALVALAEGSVSRSGALVGAAIGLIVYLGAGWEGWVMLFATFVCAAVTSKVGWQRKSALGISEEREGRRGAGNALANCLVAAIAAVVAVTTPWQREAWLALVTALAAGASDTVASEIGKAYGTRTFSVITWRLVPPGTSGAMSGAGTIAGIVSALALGALGAALGFIPLAGIWVVAVASTIGALVESVLGATLEERRIVDNDLLNFINTAVAAAVSIGIWELGVGS